MLCLFGPILVTAPVPLPGSQRVGFWMRKWLQEEPLACLQSGGGRQTVHKRDERRRRGETDYTKEGCRRIRGETDSTKDG